MAPGPNYQENPYQNSSNTGVAKLLARQHKQLREAAESAKIDQMMSEVREIRYRVDMMDDRMYGPRTVSIDDFDDEPEPSVEYSEPSRFSIWWSNLFKDPIWEILKRPPIK